jgi:hypothetical protein
MSKAAKKTAVSGEDRTLDLRLIRPTLYHLSHRNNCCPSPSTCKRNSIRHSHESKQGNYFIRSILLEYGTIACFFQKGGGNFGSEFVAEIVTNVK